jgi:superfamily II DNA or RNA helicase
VFIPNSGEERRKLQVELAEAYHLLPAVDKTLVQLFSVIYGKVNRNQLLSCVKQANIRDAKNKPFEPISLSKVINRLLQRNFLSQAHTEGPRCHELLTEIATKDAVREGIFETLVAAIHEKLPLQVRAYQKVIVFKDNDQLIRELRIGLYRQDFEYVEKHLKDYQSNYHRHDRLDPDFVFCKVINNPFDAQWFETLPLEITGKTLGKLWIQSVLNLEPNLELQDFLETPHAPSQEICRLNLVEKHLLEGCLTEAERTLDQISEQWLHLTSPLWGWLYFLRGEYEASISHYQLGLKTLRKLTEKCKVYFSGISGLFYILALIKQATQTSLSEAQDHSSFIADKSSNIFREIYASFNLLIGVKLGDLTAKENLRTHYCYCLEDGNSLTTFFQAFCLYWVDSKQAKKKVTHLIEPLCHKAIDGGYGWLAMEAADLLAQLLPKSSYGPQAEILREGTAILPLVDLLEAQEGWEVCLQALANLNKGSTAPQAPRQTEQRLVWFLSLQGQSYHLQPKEQKITANGSWSKGRAVALRRLHSDLDEFGYLTDQDVRVCRQIQTEHRRYYHSESYSLGEKAIVSLIGHPLVFWEESPTIRVELVKGEPELIVKKIKGEKLLLQFSPQLPDEQDLCIVKESPTRLKIVEVLPAHRQIAAILGKNNQLTVPSSAKEQVLEAINTVANMVTIHSDIGGGTINAEEVEADSTPHVHLLPAGAGLKAALLTRPFPDGGPYFRPGAGGATVIAEIDGKQFQTTRLMNQEQQLAETVITACPTLENHPEIHGEWLIPEPEPCLELLLELQDLGDQVIVEWPEGEKFRIQHRANLRDFQMQIKSQQDWFAADGQLKLDDDKVWDMQQLMALLDQTSSRFIALGNGQFLALTEEFRKRLDELKAYGESHGKGLRFHPLATLAIEETLDEVGKLKADKCWKDHRKRLKEMQTLQPELPSTLQAQLRDYQREGFEWMARLAHWGVGACLADDMGLGKTLQALAVILTRAPQGPTLIIAPTSVCMNWVTEAQRFAPTLRPIEFGNKDRQQVLDSLRPFDLMICTYGLLQQEELANMLAQVQWQTIVLDEAQAIKNMATKRSKAAMNLQGDFKLLTTGTPIENHLGELWNLFRFINPGLLGSLERFTENFATPIERYQSKPARQHLKRLIQPFLLRRTKNQVLSELPSRTEIMLHVDLSEEEKTFYEALRREAVTKLMDSEAEAGQKHLQVLAEIMRLRRACCNPKLVMANAAPSSSKLKLFGQVVAELLENNHKALVFSQFVDHLKILRDHLDGERIAYQYLDGSTPAKARKQRVNAFQAGEGDVFLISLKAGGTGLNLTAADYVIHMDPWWNPAVEDQASDRAHRIGQRRPVTIYRLVARGTIEEKIVALHHHKRDLADSLLEGADMVGKISTEELLNLISQG